MPRRDFLRAAGAVAGGVALGGRSALGALAPRRLPRARLPQGRLLETQPSDCPIDTVVVIMMENRSFDHYLGWLGGDEHYLERGRSRYGKKFTVDAKTDLAYVDAVGKLHRTHHLVRGSAEPHPFRGCGHPIPGHSWYEGQNRAGGRLPRGRHRERHVRVRVLPRRRPPPARAPRAAFHHARPVFRVALRGHVPEPPVCVHRAVERRARGPGAVAPGHVHDSDHLREARARRGSRSPRTTPTSPSSRSGAASSTSSSSRSTITSRSARAAPCPTSWWSRRGSAATCAPTTTRRATSAWASASSARSSTPSPPHRSGRAGSSSSRTTSGAASSTT